jgi:hypothetical protein
MQLRTMPSLIDDGRSWREERHRGPRVARPGFGFRHRLFLTGGKYSVMENAAPRFVCRNDVWAISR